MSPDGPSFFRAFVRPLGLALAGCVAVGVLLGRGEPQPDPYAQALIRAHSRKMAADAESLRVARLELAKADGTVTQTITRYRTLRDTLVLTDTVQVKQFVERSDSVVRACTELQSSCERFRVHADSVIADLTLENDALKAAVPHPGRLTRVWDRVKLPLAFVAGAYIGAKVTR